jgi:lipid kinase YegS
MAVSESVAQVDVGRVNGRCFLNMATGGFGAQVTVETPIELKKILGKAAYLLTALTHFTSIRPARGRLSGPGFQWEGSFLVLAIGNARQAGGGIHLCPEAILNDGLLELRLLPQLPSDEIPQVLGVLLNQGLDAVHRKFVSARVSELQIYAAETLQINLDGEPIANTRFEVELLPGRLPLKVPLGCPLLA